MAVRIFIFSSNNCDVNFLHRMLDDIHQSRAVALKSQLKFTSTTVCFVGNDASDVTDYYSNKII